MVPRLVFQANSTFGAKALAVFPAHRLERQIGDNRVPQHRFKIDYIVLDSTLLFIFFSIRELSALVEEKFLHIDLKVIRKGIQASSAFALDFSEHSSRYQNSFVYGLQPQIQLDIRAFLNTNERHTKITRCGYMFLQCPHASRAAPEVLDVERQGRTSISVNENSC